MHCRYFVRPRWRFPRGSVAIFFTKRSYLRVGAITASLLELKRSWEGLMKYIDEYLVTGDFTLYLNVNQCKWVSIPKGNYFCFLMVVLNKEGQSSTESYIRTLSTSMMSSFCENSSIFVETLFQTFREVLKRLFCTFAKFSKKLTFLTPWYAC